VLSLSKKVRERKKGYGEENIKTKERDEREWKKDGKKREKWEMREEERG
jgi:hypothetical protein